MLITSRIGWFGWGEVIKDDHVHFFVPQQAHADLGGIPEDDAVLKLFLIVENSFTEDRIMLLIEPEEVHYFFRDEKV